MSQVPSVGRVVHYQSYGTPGGEYLPEPRAAIITEVPKPGTVGGDEEPDTVGLAVLNPEGMFFNRGVEHAPDDQPTPGHWNWPPRV